MAFALVPTQSLDVPADDSRLIVTFGRSDTASFIVTSGTVGEGTLLHAGEMTVEPVKTVSFAEVQNNPPWHLDRIDQPNRPTNGAFAHPDDAGSGIYIYIVDSGVAPSAQFGSRLLPGRNFYPASDGRVDPGATGDCLGHGTAVASAAAGSEHGVAKKSYVVPVRVFGCGKYTDTGYVVEALSWISSQMRPGDRSVVNMSLMSSRSQAVNDAVSVLAAKGAVVVAAAGNSAKDACLFSPSSAPDSVSVAATDSMDNYASFSNHGPCVDISAPGVGLPLWGINGIQIYTGTSVSAPLVAGATAVAWSSSTESTANSVSQSVLDSANYSEVSNTPPGTTSAFLQTAGASRVPLFASTRPTRVVDSRHGLGVRQGRLTPGIEYHTGIDAETATAVLLNVTAVDSQTRDNAYFSLYQCDSLGSAVSSLNFSHQQTAARLVWVPTPDGLPVCVTSSGSSHIVVDYLGRAVLDSGFTENQKPRRVIDTRSQSTPFFGKVGGSRILKVTRDMLEGRGQSALIGVTLANVEADGREGFATVWPCSQKMPETSVLNFTGGTDVSNTVLVSTLEDQCVYVDGKADVIIDSLAGLDAEQSEGPHRLLDTRRSDALVTASSPIEISLPSGDPKTVGRFAFLNVTSTGSTDSGFLTVTDCRNGITETSNLNYTRHRSVANAVIIPSPLSGKVCVRASSDTHVIVDFQGWGV